jgi:hypothetical protein
MIMDFASMETLLPFLLVIAVVYGALETSGMFKNRAIRSIIAVVLGFFAISNYQVTSTINSFLPYAALAFLVIFVAGYVRKSLGGKESRDNTMVIILMGLGLLFIASLFRGESGFELYQYTEFLWIVGIVVVIAILYGAYKMGNQ